MAQITEQKYDLSEDFKPRKYMVKPIKEIKKTIKLVFFLFCEFTKQIAKKNKPHIKPGTKLLNHNSPKTHINQVN